MELKDILKEGSNKMNIEVKDHQIDQLIKYKDILLEWNQKMNLTAIEDEKEVMIKHFLDSLSCLKINYLKNEGSIIDVGTGAGFPGVPLKIALPDTELTLLDSLKKRIGFLEHVCEETKLNNVHFVHGRAEDFGQNKDYREKYDYAVSRAVAALNVLVEYCMPFVKKGGYFICQKGPGLIEELPKAKKAIEILGGEVIDQLEIPLPFSDITHHILVIKKIRQTPTKYPRKAGKPSKNPIK